MATPTSTAGASVAPGSTMAAVSKPTHRYTTEMAQMCFVFHGEPKEVEEEVVQYLEDIVRAQLGEVIQQARALAARRGARLLSVDDLIFLMRHDREKLLRIRTYLSWKDVRKKVKDSEADEELDNTEEDDRTLKAWKMDIKIPWDVSSMFGDYLSEETDGADAEEIEAFEISKPRLKAADDLTAAMTKEQYLHYADCAQASFVYRKSKKFRDFLCILNALDAGAFNDEVMDVLAFIAFEMVRALCESAIQVKRNLALARAGMAVKVLRMEKQKEVKDEEKRGRSKRKRGTIDEGDEGENGAEPKNGDDDDATPKDKASAPSPANETSSKKRKGAATPGATSIPSPRSPPRALIPPTSLFSEPAAVPDPAPSASTPKPTTAESILEGLVADALDVQEKGPPLSLAELNAGYVALAQRRVSAKAGGMRNFRGGLMRSTTRFV